MAIGGVHVDKSDTTPATNYPRKNSSYPYPSGCRWCTCWPGPVGWPGYRVGRRAPGDRQDCSTLGSNQEWCPCLADRCRTSGRTGRTSHHSGVGRAKPCTGKTAWIKDAYSHERAHTHTHMHIHTHACARAHTHACTHAYTRT